MDNFKSQVSCIEKISDSVYKFTLNDKSYIFDLGRKLKFRVLDDTIINSKNFWKDKKLSSIQIAEFYRDISFRYSNKNSDKYTYYFKKYRKIYNCCSRLRFAYSKDNPESIKLNQIFSCFQTLCPLCSWRRSIKLRSQARKIIECFLSKSYQLKIAYKNFILDLKKNNYTQSKHKFELMLKRKKPSKKLKSIENWEKNQIKYKQELVDLEKQYNVNIIDFNNNYENIYNKFTERNYRLFMITLTIPNCQFGELSDSISLILKSYEKFVKRPEWYTGKMLLGWYRGLEVTYNKYRFITTRMFKQYGKEYFEKRGLHQGDLNPNFRTFHPHLHFLICVDSKWWNSKGISEKKLLQMWRECTGIEEITQVDIEAVKCKNKIVYNYDTKVYEVFNSDGECVSTGENYRVLSLMGALLEITKYTVKDKEIICQWDNDLTCDVIEELDKSLKYRKLCEWGGLFRHIQNILNLKDVESDDNLVNINDDTSSEDELVYVDYFWHTGFNEYLLQID